MFPICKFCFALVMTDSTTINRKSVFTDSTPLLGDFDALRARAEEDGFLFFQTLPAP